MNFSQTIQEIEQQPEKISGRFELDFVFFSFLLFLTRTIIISISSFEENYGGNPLIDSNLWASILYDSIGISLAMMLTLLLATKIGFEIAKRLIKSNKGTLISMLIPLISLIYLLIGILFDFPQFQQYIQILSIAPFYFLPYWVNGLISAIIIGFGLKASISFSLLREEKIGLFAVLRKRDKKLTDFKINFTIFLLLSPMILLAYNLGWISIFGPIAIFILFSLAKASFLNRNSQGFTFGDLLTTALPVGILIAFQPAFPLIWTLTVPIAAAIIMVRTDLGREHFHYSFVPKSGEEIVKIFYMMLLGLVIFIPMAILVGFIRATTFLESEVKVSTLIGYIGTWVYLVGISEEFIFRCLLLILIKDGIIFWNKKKNCTGILGKISSAPYFSAMIIAAFIFGIFHASKGLDYAFLAFLAGILYGYPFVKYKNLFGPIMLHAFVDVIAVAYFAAPL